MKPTKVDEEETSAKKRTRGTTTIKERRSKKKDGEKRLVIFNEDGVPIGDSGHKFISFIGSTVHHHIPITYKKWPSVPRELKEKLFNIVENDFEFDGRAKKKVLRTGGIAFRQFKNILTTKWIMPFKDQPEILENPPTLYSFLDKTHWTQFVKSRLTPEFEKLRAEQQEKQASNKYPHRLSRKGYANKKEEMKNEGLDESQLQRHNMWKIARSNKKGEIVDKHVQEVVDKMDDIIASVDPTTHKFPNPNDVLTQALGTPEHTGRVRGVGGFITPTSYFHTPKSELKRTAKEIELANENELLRQRIQELEANQRNTQDTPNSEQGSCTKQVLKNSKKNEDKVDDEVIISRVKLSTEQLEDIIKPSIKGKSCLLAKDVISNIVASGILLEDKILGSTIHGIPLGENNVRVSIDVAIVDVALPITVRDDLKTTKQSIGSHVPWPRNLVILNEEMKVKSKEIKDKIKVGDLQMLDLPEGLNYIFRHAESVMKADSSISMQLPEGLFGTSRKSCVLRDDIIDFCNMKEVKTLSLVAYMAYLYSYCIDSGRAQKYIFVDPSLISFGQYTPEIRARNLCSRLKVATKDQLVVAPYNPGGHWSLLIVNPYEDIIYHLDSLRTSSKVDIKSVTCTALAIFRAQMKVTVERNKTHWRNVKCPLQLGTVECGYYVMRYMRDIITKDITIITDSVDTRRPYTKIELDEVRVEWANFIGRYY